jgi:hypothetical protein
MTARLRAVVAVTALVVVAVALLVIWYDPGVGGPRAWLRTVCGPEAEVAMPPADRSYDDYRAEGTLTCTTPDHSETDYYYADAVAFWTRTDPADQLLSAVDGWESGDGVDLSWATRKTGEDTWAVVFSVDPSREIEDGLDRLDGFETSGSDEVFGGRGD